MLFHYDIAFINIKQLIQVETSFLKLKVSGSDMKKLPLINDAFLIIKNDEIINFGKMNDFITDSSFEVIDEIESTGIIFSTVLIE